MSPPRIQLRRSGGPLRCPCCLDVLVPERGAPIPLLFCAGCGTAGHEACVRELGRCPIRGCGRTPALPLAERPPDAGPCPVSWEAYCREESPWLELGAVLDPADAWAEAPPWEAPALEEATPERPDAGDEAPLPTESPPPSQRPRPASWDSFCRAAAPWLRLGEDLADRDAWAEVSWSVEVDDTGWATLFPDEPNSASSPSSD